MDISSIDKNFKIAESFGRDDIELYDPREAPFRVYGVFYEDGLWRRMPKEIAKNVNEGVDVLSEHTSGGRICFTTDSDCIAITCDRPEYYTMPHMTRAGNGGFTLYQRVDGKWQYRATVMSPTGKSEFTSLIDLKRKKHREFMLQMPLYSKVSSLYIGLSKGSALGEWSEGYTREKPIVFYGSSITQGGCASTSGSDYVGRISRRFDSNYINLGFSGSARGEDVMMDYLAGLDMSVFVYDYDHNAPTPEHLERTHYKGYAKVRAAHPDVPIIMMTRPDFVASNSEMVARRDIVAATYRRALDEGDKNVYFIDGQKVFATFIQDDCTVDGVHPNDLGFYRMAEELGAVLEEIWK